MAYRPTYSAGKFAMQLDGVDVGFVASVEGGEPFGVVVEEAPVGAKVAKHLENVQFAPIVLEFGGSITEPLQHWVAAMLDGTQTRKDGAIVLLDYNLKEQSRLEWKSALITEVGFPAADGSSKEAARLRVTIQPDSSHLVAGSGMTFQSKSPPKTHKAFQSSNFRFVVSGLESSCAKVVEVAPVVVRWQHVDDPVGPIREVSETGILDVSDLVFWLPESELVPFNAWFEEFVIKGKNDSGQERTASLVFLEPNYKGELIHLDFTGVGIFRISHERQEVSSGVLARVKLELYCETVRLTTAATSAPPRSPAASTVDRAMASLASALVSALRADPAVSVPTAEALTERLLASVEPAPVRDERRQAHDAGLAWANGEARLDELAAVAALADRDDWTALVLPEGHSMVGFLAANRYLDAGEVGPIDLHRDEFTAGLVGGAAEVYREVAPRLGEHRSPNP